MSDTPWTPGPWDFDAEDLTVYAQEPGPTFIVEPVDGWLDYDMVQAQANARLIAAAPEMAELLMRIEAAADPLLGVALSALPLPDDVKPILARIRGEA
jgi:hypothetical protein